MVETAFMNPAPDRSSSNIIAKFQKLVTSARRIIVSRAQVFSRILMTSRIFVQVRSTEKSREYCPIPGRDVAIDLDSGPDNVIENLHQSSRVTG